MHDLRGCPGRYLDHKAKIQETLSSRQYAVHGKPLKAAAKKRQRKWSAQCMQLGWRPDKPLSDIE
eukprot:6319576-Amphidinium_carterae.1